MSPYRTRVKRLWGAFLRFSAAQRIRDDDRDAANAVRQRRDARGAGDLRAAAAELLQLAAVHEAVVYGDTGRELGKRLEHEVVGHAFADVRAEEFDTDKARRFMTCGLIHIVISVTYQRDFLRFSSPSDSAQHGNSPLDA